MFCVTDNNGDEIVVVNLGKNVWEAAFPDGEYVTFEADSIAEACTKTKELAEDGEEA